MVMWPTCGGSCSPVPPDPQLQRRTHVAYVPTYMDSSDAGCVWKIVAGCQVEILKQRLQHAAALAFEREQQAATQFCTLRFRLHLSSSLV